MRNAAVIVYRGFIIFKSTHVVDCEFVTRCAHVMGSRGFVYAVGRAGAIFNFLPTFFVCVGVLHMRNSSHGLGLVVVRFAIYDAYKSYNINASF